MIYDFLFVVITARFYRKSYNQKLEARPNKVIQFYKAQVNCYCKSGYISIMLYVTGLRILSKVEG